MLQRHLSISAVTAGLLAVVISYAGPLLIYFQAAQSAHASPEMLASWVWAISMGAGVSGIVLSWWLKAPIVTAWSAPGTALLITLFPHLSLNEAVGAYLTAGAIVLAIGLSGSFDALMRHIPKGVAAGMMAGILFQFGAKAFKAVEALPVLTLCMIAAFLVFKRWRPRYHMLMVLALGVALTAFGPFSTPIPWSQMRTQRKHRMQRGRAAKNIWPICMPWRVRVCVVPVSHRCTVAVFVPTWIVSDSFLTGAMAAPDAWPV